MVSSADGLILPPGLAGLPLEKARRVGQALWMSVGEPLSCESLVWARGVIGSEGDRILWATLLDWGVMTDSDLVVRPEPLASFLSVLCGGARTATESRVVWTLPDELRTMASSQRYVDAAVSIVDESRERLDVVSPFLEARGMGHLLEAIARALSRDVHVRLLAHDVDASGSLASKALADLRKEVALLPGKLEVYAAKTEGLLLIHSKIVAADEKVALIGSANLTQKGLQENFEAGVVVEGPSVRGIQARLDAILQSSLVGLAFSIGR